MIIFDISTTVLTKKIDEKFFDEIVFPTAILAGNQIMYYTRPTPVALGLSINSTCDLTFKTAPNGTFLNCDAQE